MSYPFYTLNFIDTTNAKVLEDLNKLPIDSGTPETFNEVARIARAAIAAGAVTVVKGSHTHGLVTRNGKATAFLSHNDELHDTEPTINVVIF